MSILVTSPAFSDGGAIPRKHTCDAENLSPSLSWTGIPAQTSSLVLVVDDPDAPGRIFVHWLLYDIPPDQTGLPEGVKGVGTPGTNDFRQLGYGGPCPPRGTAHRYFFKLYALDVRLDLKAGLGKSDLEKAMKGHILAQGQLMGKYSR